MSGIHGAGAARYAHQFRRAVWGVGEGITGDCYALPTKGLNITFMDLDQVQKGVQKFMKYAYDHPNTEFQVTQVGCGLSGFTKEQIAPMFEYAWENCYFDYAWRNLLPPEKKFWGTFA